MFFSMVATFWLLLIVCNFSTAQFYDASLPWQFAGYAAINIPATNNEELPSYQSLPYSPFHQFASSVSQFEQHPPQTPIITQQPHQLLTHSSSLPKRETHNPLKYHEKEQHQELPVLTKSSTTLEHASYLSLINDKENFQASGCGWDLIRLQCHDLFGLCKGGCRDFAIALNSPIHDCRCIPFGYLALLKLAGK